MSLNNDLLVQMLNTSKNNQGGSSQGVVQEAHIDTSSPDDQQFVSEKRRPRIITKFTCEECGRSFSYRANLEAHRVSHTDLKYACGTCGKVFSQFSRLQKHERYVQCSAPSNKDMTSQEEIVTIREESEITAASAGASHDAAIIGEEVDEESNKTAGAPEEQKVMSEFDVEQENRDLDLPSYEVSAEYMKTYAGNLIKAHEDESKKETGVMLTENETFTVPESVPKSQEEVETITYVVELDEGEGAEDIGGSALPEVQETPEENEMIMIQEEVIGDVQEVPVTEAQAFIPNNSTSTGPMITQQQAYVTQTTAPSFAEQQPFVTPSMPSSTEVVPAVDRMDEIMMYAGMEVEVQGGEEEVVEEEVVNPQNRVDLSAPVVVSAPQPVADTTVPVPQEAPSSSSKESSKKHSRRILSHNASDDVISCECEVCGKQFDSFLSLSQHERVHKREKSFGCMICGKVFTLRGNLKVHMTSHTEGKDRFKCDRCERCFSQQHRLNMHRQYTSYKCEKCQKYICGKNVYDKHIKDHASDKRGVAVMVTKHAYPDPQMKPITPVQSTAPEGTMAYNVANPNYNQQSIAQTITTSNHPGASAETFKRNYDSQDLYNRSNGDESAPPRKKNRRRYPPPPPQLEPEEPGAHKPNILRRKSKSGGQTTKLPGVTVLQDPSFGAPAGEERSSQEYGAITALLNLDGTPAAAQLDEDHEAAQTIIQEQQPAAEELFSCRCNLKFKNKVALQQHQEICLTGTEPAYTCDQCEKSFLSIQQLSLHGKLVHRLPVGCSCGKRFKTEEEWTQHLTLGVCHTCGTHFYNTESLHKHFLPQTVNSKTPMHYRCKKCGAQLVHSELSNHGNTCGPDAAEEANLLWVFQCPMPSKPDATHSSYMVFDPSSGLSSVMLVPIGTEQSVTVAETDTSGSQATPSLAPFSQAFPSSSSGARVTVESNFSSDVSATYSDQQSTGVATSLYTSGDQQFPASSGHTTMAKIKTEPSTTDVLSSSNISHSLSATDSGAVPYDVGSIESDSADASGEEIHSQLSQVEASPSSDHGTLVPKSEPGPLGKGEADSTGVGLVPSESVDEEADDVVSSETSIPDSGSGPAVIVTPVQPTRWVVQDNQCFKVESTADYVTQVQVSGDQPTEATQEAESTSDMAEFQKSGDST